MKQNFLTAGKVLGILIGVFLVVSFFDSSFTGRVVDAPSCTDSDGGLNYGVVGTITLINNSGTFTVTDFCHGPDSMEEYFCNADSLARDWQQCQQNEVCYNGACVPGQCSDSDGGGVNQRSVRGEVTFTSSGEIVYSASDRCEIYRFGVIGLKEYSCQNLPGSTGECPYNTICRDGACVDNRVVEGGACQRTIECQQGLVCDTQVCQRVTCTDSDNGQNLPKSKATVTITKSVTGTTTQDDTCIPNSAKVNEYGCNADNTLRTIATNCPAGYLLCQNGACVAAGGSKQSCNYKGECNLGFSCTNNVCLGIAGTKCIDNAGCVSGQCVANVCK